MTGVVCVRVNNYDCYMDAALIDVLVGLKDMCRRYNYNISIPFHTADARMTFNTAIFLVKLVIDVGWTSEIQYICHALPSEFARDLVDLIALFTHY